MQSIQLPRPATALVLAAGAWLKNTAARIDGARVRWSEVHGDLSDPERCAALEQSMAELAAVGELDAVAHDLHPDFFSTRLAQSLAGELGVPAVAVQHHHAHVAAVQAEYGIAEPVIGLALDGVGLGTDGTAWGGELLWVQGARWRRLGHLRELRLPGGDVAAREPWRVAAAVLHDLGRVDEIESRFPSVAPAAKAGALRSMLDRNVNCPVTSSAGRWFDSAAGVLNLCLRQEHEAQAAIALESAAAEWLCAHEVVAHEALVRVLPDGRLDLHPLIERLLALGDAGAVAEGAAVFHVSLADGLVRWAREAARRHDVGTIVLGGGCFFNRILSERVQASLRAAGLRVLRPDAVNCGDAGIALGQAWVAAHAIADRAGEGAERGVEEASACA